MNEFKRVNPRNTKALTVDDVASGARIICWRPGNPASTRRLTIVESYTDEDDNMVVDVEDETGRLTTELTSSVGLTCHRYTGEWSTIAVPNEEVD